MKMNKKQFAALMSAIALAVLAALQQFGMLGTDVTIEDVTNNDVINDSEIVVCPGEIAVKKPGLVLGVEGGTIKAKGK